jgi:hypothetical protein
MNIRKKYKLVPFVQGSSQEQLIDHEPCGYFYGDEIIEVHAVPDYRAYNRTPFLFTP